VQGLGGARAPDKQTKAPSTRDHDRNQGDRFEPVGDGIARVTPPGTSYRVQADEGDDDQARVSQPAV
jgi:hypothetical protein